MIDANATGGGRRMIFLDVDDVLVDIAGKWAWRAVNALQTVQSHDLIGVPEAEAPLVAKSRKIGDLWEWLSRGNEVSRECERLFYEIYRSDRAFYDDLASTYFCRAIQGMLDIRGWAIDTHMITYCHDPDDACVRSKLEWLKRQFGRFRNVEFHLGVIGAETKAEIIYRIHPGVHDLFVDDSPGNVTSILLDDRVTPKEILLPKLGYNHPLAQELEVLARLRNIALSYYERT